MNEDDELIDDAAELLKSGVFENDLNLRKSITMFQRRFRIGWHRGFNLASALRKKGLLINPVVDDDIDYENQQHAIAENAVYGKDKK